MPLAANSSPRHLSGPVLRPRLRAAVRAAAGWMLASSALWVAFSASAVSAAAAASAAPASPTQPAEITVAAASSLSEALRDIAARFEAARPGTRVRLTFGASGALAQQISRGAPVDVFASADEETMTLAVGRGWVDGKTVVRFATNRLVLIAPRRPGAPPVAALADLARPDVQRVALGQPASVPAGRYARAALERAGLWAAVQPKQVGAASVRQVLDYVARGEVDAGFVYATDAARQEARVRVVAPVEQADPVRYPAAVVAASPQPAVARAFVAFLTSPSAQAVLAVQGFGGAPAATAPPLPQEAPR